MDKRSAGVQREAINRLREVCSGLAGKSREGEIVFKLSLFFFGVKILMNTLFGPIEKNPGQSSF